MVKEVNPSVAPRQILCADIWPKDKLDKPHMDAYKRVEDDGIIQIRKIVYDKAHGLVSMEYMSQIPHQWALDHLKKALFRRPDRQLKLNIADL